MSESGNKLSAGESSGMIADCPPNRRSEVIDLEIPAPPLAEEEQQGNLHGFCSICSEEVLPPGERSIALLPCGHKFHLDCIGSAFNAKNLMECPNCRRVERGQWLYAAGIPPWNGQQFYWDSGTGSFSSEEPVLEGDGPNSGTGGWDSPHVIVVCRHIADYLRDLGLENGVVDMHPGAPEGGSSDSESTHWTALQNHHCQHHHHHQQQQQPTLNWESSADEVSLELALRPPMTEPRGQPEFRTSVHPLVFHYGFASNVPATEEVMDMDHHHLGGHIDAFVQVLDSSAPQQAVASTEVGVTNGHAVSPPMFPNDEDLNLLWSILAHNNYERFTSNVPVTEEVMDMENHHHLRGHINDFLEVLDSSAPHQAVASTEVGVTNSRPVPEPVFLNDQDFDLAWGPLSPSSFPPMPFAPSADAAAGSPWPTPFPAHQQHLESPAPDTTTTNLFQVPMTDGADHGRPDIGNQLMPNHGQGI